MKRLTVFLLAGLLLTGCVSRTQSPPEPPSSVAAVSSEVALPVRLDGSALETLGYQIAVPSDVGVENPNDESAWFDYYEIVRCSDENVKTEAGRGMRGEYTLVALLALDYMSSAYLGTAYLQGFPNEMLVAENAEIAVGGETYSPDALEQYRLWSDDDVTIYDFAPLVETEPFEARLNTHAESVRELLENPKGIEERKAIGRYNQEYEARILNWNDAWLNDLNTVFCTEMKQWICKNTA